MEYNRATIADYNTHHGAAQDAAGWTADEKENGKLDSFDYNPVTAAWDIPNTTVKTTALFGYIQNPDESDDVVFEKQTDSLTVIDESTHDTLMTAWFPEEE